MSKLTRVTRAYLMVRVAAPTLILLALALATSASAQAAWTRLGALTDPGLNALDPVVAMGTGGDTVFAWTRRDATSDCSGSGCKRVEIRARAADGTLSATQVLSAPGQNAYYPAVAVYPNGDAIITWKANATIQARVRAADGILSPIQTLSPLGRNADSPRVKLDGSGNAVIGWYAMDATTDCAGPVGGRGCFRIQTRVRALDGTLSPTQTLSARGEDAIFYRFAVNPAGTAVFAWQRNDGTSDCAAQLGCDRIQGRVRAADGTLSATQTLTVAGQSALAPTVDVDTAGDALFGWLQYDGTNERAEVRWRSESGTLAATQPLSSVGKNAGAPSVTVDSAGNAIVAWLFPDATTDCGGSGCGRLQARTRSAAGVLGATQVLSPAGEASVAVGVAGDVNGNAIFVWQFFDGTTGCGGFPGCLRLQARARSAAGGIGPVATLSEPGQDARAGGFAVDPDGGLDPKGADAAALWALRPETPYCCDILHAAVLIRPSAS